MVVLLILFLSIFLVAVIILIDSKKRLGRYSWGWALFALFSLFGIIGQIGKQWTAVDRWSVAGVLGTLTGSLFGLFFLYRTMTRGQAEKNKIRGHNENGKSKGGEESPVQEELYLEAMREVETHTLVEALWVKSYAESGGDEVKAKLLYVKLRAKQLSKEKREREEEAAIVRAGMEKEHSRIRVMSGQIASYNVVGKVLIVLGVVLLIYPIYAGLFYISIFWVVVLVLPGYWCLRKSKEIRSDLLKLRGVTEE